MSTLISIIAPARKASNARLQRVISSLIAEGFSIELFASGDAKDLPAQVTFHQLPEEGRSSRLKAALRLPKIAQGKVIFTPDPEVAVVLWLRSFFNKTTWVVDVREDYRLLLKDRKWAKGATYLAAVFFAELAVFASKRADLTIVVDNWVRPANAKNRLVIPNAPDPRFLPAIGAASTAPRALYVGDVRASRGLWTMLRAMEMSDPWRLDVVGPVAKEDQAALDAWQKSSPAAARVNFHGTLTPEKSWHIATGAWVGLALLDSTPAFKRAWPTKIGEYLACGIPVISTDLPRPSEVILQSRAGALVESASREISASQCAGILNSWGENPDEYREVRDRAVKEVEIWRSGASYDLIGEGISQLLAR